MSQTNPPYIYVVVRTDIPVADQMVQVGHACHMSGHHFGCPKNCHLVLCQTPDEDSLDAIHDYMHGNDIRHVMFEEDKDDMGWTSLCTEPLTDKRPLLRHLRLWRPKKPWWKFW